MVSTLTSRPTHTSLIHRLVNTFAIASSGIVAGLSWWQALIATALGYSMAAPFLCLNGRPGAIHHIKFPAVARASFGIWLSNWIVIQRVCMSIVWWSGECSQWFVYMDSADDLR